MNINLNKNVVAIVIVVIMALGLTIVGSKVLTDKIANKVIEELRRDYSPGPYNPGFDPDKVDPNFFRPNTPPQNYNQSPQNYQPPQNYNQPQSYPRDPNYPPPMQRQSYRQPWPPKTAELFTPNDWNKAWEFSQ